MAGSYVENPVMFPPGRAMLATKPALEGSVTWTNTIGILLVSCCSARSEGAP